MSFDGLRPMVSRSLLRGYSRSTELFRLRTSFAVILVTRPLCDSVKPVDDFRIPGAAHARGKRLGWLDQEDGDVVRAAAPVRLLDQGVRYLIKISTVFFKG